jgi:hypothetical protein
MSCDAEMMMKIQTGVYLRIKFEANKMLLKQSVTKPVINQGKRYKN